MQDIKDILTTLNTFPLFENLTIKTGAKLENGLRLTTIQNTTSRITPAQVKLINRALRPTKFYIEPIGLHRNSKFLRLNN